MCGTMRREPVTVEIVVERLHANLALAQQAIANLLPRHRKPVARKS